MKKLICAVLCVGFLTNSLYAARALLLSIEDIGAYTDAPAATVVRWNFRVVYQGTDVPGTVQKASLTVSISTSTTPAQIQAAIVTAIQNEATSRSFTVPNGATILPTYGAQ